MDIGSHKDRRERDWGKKIFEEIIVEISPNLVKNINPQIHKAEQNKNSTSTKKTILGHKIVKQTSKKKKRNILIAAKGGKLLHMGEQQ